MMMVMMVNLDVLGLFVAMLMCFETVGVQGKEVLPSVAYFNRTIYPPIIEYDPKRRPHMSIGLFSDVQFADQEEKKRRHFRLSPGKLDHAINEMNVNRSHLDFVIHLGDLVDHSMEKNLPTLTPILKKLKFPFYQVLGNHDFLMTDEAKFGKIHQMLGMPAKYYSFSGGPEKKYKFVVLDGNDIALYSTVAGSAERREAERIQNILKRRRAKNSWHFNGAVGETQMKWMKGELQSACNQGQRVVIFLHHPIRPKDEPTNLWNDLEIVPIISEFPCVLCVINGHAHKFMNDFHYTLHRHIHFITFGGMVQSPFTSFGFADFYEDELHIHGLIFGRPISNRYDLKPHRAAFPVVLNESTTELLSQGVKFPLTPAQFPTEVVSIAASLLVESKDAADWRAHFAVWQFVGVAAGSVVALLLFAITTRRRMNGSVAGKVARGGTQQR